MSPDDKGYRAIDEHEQTFSPIAEQADCICEVEQIACVSKMERLGSVT
jgi:predicted nucleotide-binding protein